MSANRPPDDILDAVRLIRRLREKNILTREEKIDVNRAKLRVAYWACRSESVIASRETLSYILGSDATEIMSQYDRYLEREKEKENERGKDRDKQKRPGRQDKTTFWDGA